MTKIRKDVETASDISYEPSPIGPRWRRDPYAAELRKTYGDARVFGIGKVIGYRIILTEFGRKPREVEVSLSERPLPERIGLVIARHLNGPKDLS
jgi:hypothetical protein